MKNVIIISRINPRAISLVTQLAEIGCPLEVVLLSEAIFMPTGRGECSDMIKKASKLGANFLALSEDVSKRGVEKLLQNITVINYSSLVDLLLQKSKRTINL